MESKINELKEKIAELQREVEQLAKQESKYFDFSPNKLWILGKEWDSCYLSSYDIQVRNEAEFMNKGFYLNDVYTWEIVRDSKGGLVLLPTKKIE